jgi:hypothetical protein
MGNALGTASAEHDGNLLTRETRHNRHHGYQQTYDFLHIGCKGTKKKDNG